MEKVFALSVAAALALCSCMSDKEYQLRSKDIEAKKAHPATYQPIVITGPLTLQEGASIAATVPSQPYVPTAIPDGAALQAQLIRDVAGLAAITGTAGMGIHKAGDTTKVYNNGSAAAAEGGE